MTSRTSLESWQALLSHATEMKSQHMNDLFSQDENRFDKFSIQLPALLLDYSKNIVTENTIRKLIQLARECDVEDWRSKMFNGDAINRSEDRSVLHVALRDNSGRKLVIDEDNVSEQVEKSLCQIKKFSEKVRRGQWKGFSGKRITDIVNIGVGGSSLGPQMVTEALKEYSDNSFTVHYVF